MRVFHWLCELRFNPRKTGRYQAFIQQHCPYNLTPTQWSGRSLYGSQTPRTVVRLRMWHCHCSLQECHCREQNDTSGASNCLWFVTCPCSSPRAIHTGNSWEEFTSTPQQDIARAVGKQEPTPLLGLQGRWNRKTIHETHGESKECTE